MKTKSNKQQKRFSTQSTLRWYLDVGYHYATMTETQARQIARVEKTTFDRWLAGTAAAPLATLELLRIHAFGEPPTFGREWRGFRFQNGRLITQDERYLTPNDLMAVFYWRQLASSYITTLNESRRREIYDDLRVLYQQA